MPRLIDDLANGANAFTLVFEGAVGDYGYALPATGAAISASPRQCLSRRRDCHRPRPQHAVEGRCRPHRNAGQGARTCCQGRDDPLRLRPDRRDRHKRAKPAVWTDIAPIFAGLVGISPRQDFAGPFAVADGRVIHAAGGSEAQELAFTLASAVAYLRALEQGGIALDDASRFIYFRLAADQDQFLTIAKLRAIRKLWSRIEAGLRARSAPRLRRRRDRLAHDDQARSAWKHRARHHRRARRRGRRGRCGDGAAVQRGARHARRLRPPRRPQHADSSSSRRPICIASPIPPPARAPSKR